MASTIYPKFKEKLLQHGNYTDLSTSTVKFVMVSSAYTYSIDHEYKNQITGIMQDSTGLAEASFTVIDPSGNTPAAAGITPKTFEKGVFATDNSTYTFTAPIASVTLYNAMVFYVDTGLASTSPLVAYIDGLSVVPNGGDVSILWDDFNPINGVQGNIIFSF